MLTAMLLTVLLAVLRPGLVTGTCGGLQGDVVFVLDASGSVGSSNFQTMLQFVQDLVTDFDVDPSLVQVAVVRYDSSVSTIFHFDSYTTASSVNSAIAAIAYTGGLTNTADAIDTMRTTFTSGANGDRTGVPNVGIVITDGASNSFSLTSAAAANARSAGFTIFSIGIGTGVTELNAIASDPDSDHVFTVSSFSGLASIESAFKVKACSSASYIGSPPATISDSDDSSVDAGAVAGGVVGAVAGVGAVAAAVAVYMKVSAAKTAISSLPSTNAANPETGPQSSEGQKPETDNNLPEIPGLVDGPAQIQPMDTRLPARLPPLRL